MTVMSIAENASLRPLAAGDAERLVAICRDAALARMTRALPWPYTRAEADIFLADCAAQRTNGHGRVLGVVLGADDQARLVGTIAWKPTTSPQVGDIGYLIGRDSQGRGLATAMGRAFLETAFKEDELEAMEACVFQDNPASDRVLIKLGFTRLGSCAGRSVARSAQDNRPASTTYPTWTYRLARADWGATA